MIANGFFVLVELSNILPGKHVQIINKNHGNKDYIDFLVCLLGRKGHMYVFQCKDFQQMKKFFDVFQAIFGVKFLR